MQEAILGNPWHFRQMPSTWWHPGGLWYWRGDGLASGVLLRWMRWQSRVDLGRTNHRMIYVRCFLKQSVYPRPAEHCQVGYMPFLRKSHNVKKLCRAGHCGLQPHHFRPQTTQPLGSNYSLFFLVIIIIKNSFLKQEFTTLYGHSKSICKSSLKIYSLNTPLNC